MNCFNCFSPYDPSVRVPKILTKCGHSLCSHCILALSANDSICCPECSVPTADIANLPTNTALLSYKQRRKPLSDASNQSVAVCSQHSRPLEVYCEEDCTLLCVICVVEEKHTAHHLLNVEAASDKEREWVKSVIAQADSVEKSVKRAESEVEAAFASLKKAFDSSQKDIISLYRTIQDIVRTRQIQKLSGLTEIYTKEKECLGVKKSQCQRQIELIADMRAAFAGVERKSNVELLRNSRGNRSMASHVMAKGVTLPVPTFHFPALQRESELLHLQAAFKAAVSGKALPAGKSVDMSASSTQFRPLFSKCSRQNKENWTKSWKRPGSCSRLRSEYSKNVPIISISVDALAKTEATMREREAIYTFGGVDLYTIEKTDLEEFSSSLVASMITARASFGAAAVPPGCVTLLGGSTLTSETAYPLLALSKPASLRLPLPRSGFGFAVLAGKFYLFGGAEGDSLTDRVEVWEKGDWSAVSKTEKPLADFGYCTNSTSTIYLAGGRGPDRIQSAVQALSIDSCTWRSFPPMKSPRSKFSLVLASHSLFAIGGWDGAVPLSCVERLSLTANEWTSIAPLSSPRHSLSAVAVANETAVVCLGGFGETALDVIEELAVDAGKWKTVGRMASQRFKHVSLVLTLTDT